MLAMFIKNDRLPTTATTTEPPPQVAAPSNFLLELQRDSIARTQAAFEFFNKNASKLNVASLLVAIYLPFFCLYTYFSADPFQHSNFWLPLISDIGALKSHTFFFTNSLILIGILFFFSAFGRKTCITRYMTVDACCRTQIHRDHLELRSLNDLAFIVCILSGLGSMLIAQYPSSTSFGPHMFGVVICFGSMLLYIVLSVVICSLLHKLGYESFPKSMLVVALVGCASVCAFSVTFCLSAYEAGIDNFFDHSYRLNWSEDMAGYGWHRLSAFLEWTSLFSIVPFFWIIFRRSRKGLNHPRNINTTRPACYV